MRAVAIHAQVRAYRHLLGEAFKLKVYEQAGVRPLDRPPIPVEDLGYVDTFAEGDAEEGED